MSGRFYIKTDDQIQTRFQEDNLAWLFGMDSKDIVTGTATDGVYQTQGFTNKVFKSMSLESAEIPYSWYVFDSTNNLIVFNEGGSDLTATITPGNYDATTIITEIKTRMDAAGTLTYTPTYNSSTLKLTIAATGAFVLKFSQAGTAYKQLGWNAADTASSATQVAPRVINLAGFNYLYITVKNFVARGLTSDLQNFSFKVQVPNDPGEVVFYTQNSGINQITFQQNAGFSEQDMKISLRNPDGQLVELNGRDWSCTLRVTFYLPGNA